MAGKSLRAEEALVEFRWDVPADGLEVVKSTSEKQLFKKLKVQPALKSRKELFLVGRTPAGLESQTRRYNPLVFNPITKEDPKIQDHRPRLFQSFCDLEPTKENILEFANKCGMLVGDAPVVRKGRTKVFYGEPLGLWRREVADMKLAFGLWNALLDGDMAFLNEHIHFTKVDGCFVADCRRGTLRGGKGTEFAGFKVVDTRHERSGRARFLKEGDFRLASVFAIQDLIRKRLREHVGASVLYLPERDLPVADAGSAGTARRQYLPLGLRMVPADLLGALWLQLAQEIERGTEYRRCLMCPKRMEISLEALRRNRTTCSDKCRRALQRKREDEARVMRAEGKSVGAIAKAFGTTVAHVKAWTAKPKRPRGRPRTQIEE